MKRILLVSSLIALVSFGYAQTDTTDVFKMMDENDKKAAADVTDYTTATFKSTRVIQGPSIETIGEGNMDFRILHRFAPLSGGGKELFGLDGPATIRFGLDYGITNRLMVGIGRSNYQKEFDGFVKYKILRQSSGKSNMPITLTYIGTIMDITDDSYLTANNLSGSEAITYAHALAIGRKFNDVFSFQVTPTLVHYNKVPVANAKNNQLSIGLATRVRISKRVNFTAEYYHQFDKMEGYEDALSFGFDFETGGHVFQLHFTNATGMTERTFISQTVNKFGDNTRFGFNLTRIFTIVKSKAVAKAG